MSWLVRIARVAGIEVRVHLTFLLLLAWIGFAYYPVGGAPAAVEGILFILALFFGVLLHECGHVLRALLTTLKRDGSAPSVSPVMRRDLLPVIRPLDPFGETFRLMQRCGCPALPVVDRAHRFVGLITTENVGEMMLVRSILPPGQVRSWRAQHNQV